MTEQKSRNLLKGGEPMAAKEQNVTISIKVKLYPDQKTIEEFKKLTTAYSEAATWLSDLMFNDFSNFGNDN